MLRPGADLTDHTSMMLSVGMMRSIVKTVYVPYLPVKLGDFQVNLDDDSVNN